MDDSTEQIRRRLAAFDAAPSALEGLPALREAAEEITSLLDRTMAQAVLDGASMRAVAASAGLTGNAVPPRLARTAPLPSSPACGPTAPRDGRSPRCHWHRPGAL